MATCYNLIIDEITGLYYKHGEDVGNINGVFLCSLNHTCVVSGDFTTSLNTIADQSVVSANNSINTNEMIATSASEEITDVSVILSQETIKMKVALNIILFSPVIKCEYKPLPKTSPVNVVKKNG